MVFFIVYMGLEGMFNDESNSLLYDKWSQTLQSIAYSLYVLAVAYLNAIYSKKGALVGYS